VWQARQVELDRLVAIKEPTVAEALYFGEQDQAQFTRKVPKRAAHRWREWASRRDIDRDWMRVLASAGVQERGGS